MKQRQERGLRNLLEFIAWVLKELSLQSGKPRSIWLRSSTVWMGHGMIMWNGVHGSSLNMLNIGISNRH
jgi:hypothetical protein